MNKMLNIYCKSNKTVQWMDSFNASTPVKNQAFVFFADQKDFKKLNESLFVLSENELSRYHGLIRLNDKNNFLLSRIILKGVISKILNANIKDIVLSRQENEKPYLIHPASELHFSLSHCRGYVLVCISFNTLVGVDIEYIRPSAKTGWVASSYFSQLEQKNIREAKDPYTLFFDYWTRKEAAVKLIGLGLLEQIRSFEVCHEVNKNEVRLDIPLQHMFLESFSIHPYAACLALADQMDRIEYIRVNEQLVDSWLA
ncbi:MAG: 4'-phosphopantetheinyl transferase superfamily protein [Bacteroidetes bacterium]|nr:4'-phosphopantetheinyl transferase superfamily protein [Bacteroidota bacterium]